MAEKRSIWVPEVADRVALTRLIRAGLARQGISIALEDVIFRALEQDPDRCFTTIRELRRELKRVR